ncbi:MAG: type II secretion system protein E [Candidatus Wolfebacteria bacterium GW2011_GWC1_43_10]|uniref:Type II secretion system protein E n=1 Tax=Candidatus Wolfebacteria bacterium GW2011_GWC1_43_10 TaxID=1619011 RepID=A0A0G1EI36_9BACT|nr:MAG: type II secretion system protein E [Candidatus Wolfebacteria bacterium GW2011_GWC1_43_10]
MENKILTDKLLEQKLLSPEIAQKILQESSFSKKPVEEMIYERRLVPEESFLKIKSQILNVPFKQIDPQSIPEEVIKLIPEETVRNFKVVPLSSQDGLLVAGMVNPDDAKAQEAIKFVAKQHKVNLGIYLISLALWDGILRRYSPYRSEVEAAVKSLFSLGTKRGTSPQRVIQIESGGGAEEAPIIRIVASTMKEAVWQKSSDIHIEPQRDRLRIRFRLDGELQEVSSMPLELYQPIVSRIKVLANLKIDETRVPQDGRFRTVLLGRDIDFRVATFPTPTGEKVAMRVLDPQVGLRGLEELGLLGKNLRTLQEGISKPYGMVLITGPTGSGKTTTLYAIMQILNKEEVNVVSLEDPVEYYIDGLNQSQVHPEIGYDFASGLRQILRQDPDIIMVGEIRDNETAGLAIHAALTGHIVLSTLHTNNAAGVIPRLVDMKVEPFLLPAAVNLMVGQRLVSRLCQECISKKEPSGEVKTIIENTLASMDPAVVKESGVSAPYQVFGSKGCPVCKGKGVSGRVALFEILQMTKELEEIVVSRKSEGEIIKEAKRQKMTTLRQDGIIKALKGQVSIEMVLRETEEF